MPGCTIWLALVLSAWVARCSSSGPITLRYARCLGQPMPDSHTSHRDPYCDNIVVALWHALNLTLGHVRVAKEAVHAACRSPWGLRWPYSFITMLSCHHRCPIPHHPYMSCLARLCRLPFSSSATRLAACAWTVYRRQPLITANRRRHPILSEPCFSVPQTALPSPRK